MNRLQLPFGVNAMGLLLLVRRYGLVAADRCKKIDILLVLWRYLVIEIGYFIVHSGDQGYELEIGSPLEMRDEECQCMPSSQALRHSKLMRPDKHC